MMASVSVIMAFLELTAAKNSARWAHRTSLLKEKRSAVEISMAPATVRQVSARVIPALVGLHVNLVAQQGDHLMLANSPMLVVLFPPLDWVTVLAVVTAFA
jgi:hypothetical protein